MGFLIDIFIWLILNYDFNRDNTDKERLEYFRKLKKQELEQLNLDVSDQELQNAYATLLDILNIEYKYFKDEKMTQRII